MPCRRTRSRRVCEVPLELADRPPPGHALPEAAVDQRDELLAALRRLPSRQRAAVVLRFWEDLSVAETAAAMGCTQGTVKSSASRGLEKLRDLLASDLSATTGRGTP